MSTPGKQLAKKFADAGELEFRVYSFRELAQLYYPHLRGPSASRALRSLIALDPKFCHEMRRRGFRPSQRHLAPYQIEVLLEQLGSPREFYEILRANSPD